MKGTIHAILKTRKPDFSPVSFTPQNLRHLVLKKMVLRLCSYFLFVLCTQSLANIVTAYIQCFVLATFSITSPHCSDLTIHVGEL